MPDVEVQRKLPNKPKARGNGQGTVFQLPNGKWQAQVTAGFKDGKPRRVTVTAKTKTEAERKRSQLLSDLERGLLAIPDRITVNEYADKWLARQQDLRLSSGMAYKRELGYALEHIGTMKVKDVRSHHLKDVMTKLSERVMVSGRGKDKTMARRTQVHILTRLRSLFREAVSDQIIYVNPASSVRSTRTPSPEAVGTVLDFDLATHFHELGWALYEANLCRFWTAIFTALSVGLRRSEVCGLRWQDVDLESGMLRIRQTITTPKGKPHFSEPKTKNSKRDIHIPQSLKAALEIHKEKQAKERADAGSAWTETGAVFTTELGTWIHPDNLNRALASLIEWSNPKRLKDPRIRSWALTVIPDRNSFKVLEGVINGGDKLPDLTPHDLRHTYATLALRSRVPVEVVSRTLGHARISITLDVYRHVLDSERREQVIDLFEIPRQKREVIQLADA